MRLLVVEDEDRMTEILKRALARAGFVVDAVALCADAQAAFAVTRYDAAILDLGLPDGDGIRLLRELRSSGNQTPVLVLTARDTVEDRVCGLDTGADDYLVKPFAMTELIARTNALLRRPGSALGTLLNAGNVMFDTILEATAYASLVSLHARLFDQTQFSLGGSDAVLSVACTSGLGQSRPP